MQYLSNFRLALCNLELTKAGFWEEEDPSFGSRHASAKIFSTSLEEYLHLTQRTSALANISVYCSIIFVITGQADIITFSRIILVYYCKCCNLIDYSTRYLFLVR